ncbi:DUF503 domain-containing protein [Clostridium tepidum]|jgi:uncharacterized protein YlxP (DUF503 family)|uniref:DUF503 domain-containing protein n=1 Tax=Clostridium tepidum TaxID=1962263 RepID=A0A1S9I5Y2_9CLOT|nr:DUF503 domain-containing protein [Clostridium tepidum]MCR1933815.1 DUF503 domain-containing protein [Clostridium tepidum]MDU6878496.1 DUF503 domain-containing protein [Clostridium botulinum]OOO61602.1 hypothetical protein BS637_10975 [Clostridium tepidum]OOO65665.1 hypothetical protein BS638_08290 [Clostridium tepidum]
MIIGTAKIYLYANWIHSLKEKRMIVKSVISKTKNKFNVSIAEVEMQDIHQNIVIGIACVSNSSKQADSIIQNVVNYIEGNTEAIVSKVETEII